jgi:hypothetical protein
MSPDNPAHTPTPTSCARPQTPPPNRGQIVLFIPFKFCVCACLPVDWDVTPVWETR